MKLTSPVLTVCTLALLLSLVLLQGCREDKQAQANKLMTEAGQLVKAADSEPEPERSLVHLRKARQNLLRIVEEYPGSDQAVKLSTGQEIGSVSVASLDEKIRLLQERVDAAKATEREARCGELPSAACVTAVASYRLERMYHGDKIDPEIGLHLVWAFALQGSFADANRIAESLDYRRPWAHAILARTAGNAAFGNRALEAVQSSKSAKEQVFVYAVLIEMRADPSAARALTEQLATDFIPDSSEALRSLYAIMVRAGDIEGARRVLTIHKQSKVIPEFVGAISSVAMPKALAVEAEELARVCLPSGTCMVALARIAAHGTNIDLGEEVAALARRHDDRSRKAIALGTVSTLPGLNSLATDAIATARQVGIDSLRAETMVELAILLRQRHLLSETVKERTKATTGVDRNSIQWFQLRDLAWTARRLAEERLWLQ